MRPLIPLLFMLFVAGTLPSKLQAQTSSDNGLIRVAEKTLQSPVESSMDFLEQQIDSPDEQQDGSALSYFSNPKNKRNAIKTGATLVLVISIFLLIVFLIRIRPGNQKHESKRKSGVPQEALSVIGQIPFTNQQQLQLIRLGQRLLLVATSESGSSTLAEITDPDEAWQLETAVRDGRPDVLTRTVASHVGAPVRRGDQPSQSVSLGSRSGRTLLEA